MKYSLIILALSMLLLSACSDFVAPERFKKDNYSVSALLISGKSISPENPVWICKGMPLTHLTSPDIFVTNAAVRIKETSPTGDTLSFALTPFTFPLPDFNVTVTLYVDSLAHLIKAQHTYRIEVRIPEYSKLISAETVVPPVAELMPNFDTQPPQGYGFTGTYSDNLPVIPFDQIDLQYPVTLKVNGQQTYRYMVEVFCLEEFSTDLEFTTVFFGQEHPPADMEQNYYSLSGETIRKINMLGNFVSRQHTDGNYYLTLTDYKQCFIFYGNYKVSAYIMDENYYKYAYMPEGYFHGGVTNALGYFGSASGGVMYTKIVKS